MPRPTERETISPRPKKAIQMRTTTMLLAIGCVGAIALGTLVRFYPRPPDYAYDYPPLDDRYGYGMDLE